MENTKIARAASYQNAELNKESIVKDNKKVRNILLNEQLNKITLHRQFC